MRLTIIGALTVLVCGISAAATPAMAQGILVATDDKASNLALTDCMVAARRALSGTGMVLQTASASVIGSNEERTISIRCGIPGVVSYVEAFFPGQKDQLDPIEAAFDGARAAPLIASVSKSHQLTVDCTRQTSCQIDPAAVCRQAYPAGGAPSAKVMSQQSCADNQGAYACEIVYDLNCN